MKVRCGEWDTQQSIEPKAHQDRDIYDMSLDPGFDAKNLANDFALLYTSEDFDLDRHLDVACLPQGKFETYDKAECVATGWGKDEFGKGKA